MNNATQDQEKYFNWFAQILIFDSWGVLRSPTNVKARAQTWSNYKHHNNLLGIAPQGAVTERLGRKSAWRSLFRTACGLLENLCNGDTILADRGLHASIETLYRAGGKCDSCGAKQAVHNNSQFFRGTSSEIHCEGQCVFDPRAFGDEIINTTTFLLKLWKVKASIISEIFTSLFWQWETL